MTKPRVFIASAAERLDVADAINVNLDHDAEVTVWKNGFSLSTSSIDSLLNVALSADFAIFVFTPDDESLIRNESKNVVRDNVLFELGLFIGELGKNRCFIVKPRDTDLHFPTDLLGMTIADYDGHRSDGDLASAINHPCVLIKKEIAKTGLISQDIDAQKKRRRQIDFNYKLGTTENLLLKTILEHNIDCKNNSSVTQVFNHCNDEDKSSLALASIKLERIGYIERTVDNSEHEDHHVFHITTDGTDYLLENEELLKSNSL